eukprot:gnl/Chilomastix_cuspidata/2659.p1 GENE.gnl/Chilomastix_cuspidata/2659~~gnl/Chilomastix_cuspidata/2659.p1  ORF type:complete len:315 (+),score=26.34 gnl/Chilomastix_cuspidata/2659:959-1903(+)
MPSAAQPRRTEPPGACKGPRAPTASPLPGAGARAWGREREEGRRAIARSAHTHCLDAGATSLSMGRLRRALFRLGVFASRPRPFPCLFARVDRRPRAEKLGGSSAAARSPCAPFREAGVCELTAQGGGKLVREVCAQRRSGRQHLRPGVHAAEPAFRARREGPTAAAILKTDETAVYVRDLPRPGPAVLPFRANAGAGASPRPPRGEGAGGFDPCVLSIQAELSSAGAAPPKRLSATTTFGEAAPPVPTLLSRAGHIWNSPAAKKRDNNYPPPREGRGLRACVPRGGDTRNARGEMWGLGVCTRAAVGDGAKED